MQRIREVDDADVLYKTGLHYVLYYIRLMLSFCRNRFTRAQQVLK